MNKKGISVFVAIILLILIIAMIGVIMLPIFPLILKATQSSSQNICLDNDGIYPNFECSSGANITVSLDVMCKKGYTATVRNVSEKTRKEVLKKYNVSDGYGRTYELDHIVPLCMGGSNDAENLWLEPSTKGGFVYGYQKKDGVERLLCNKVCNGTITLEEAQYQIVYNWTGWVKK